MSTLGARVRTYVDRSRYRAGVFVPRSARSRAAAIAAAGLVLISSVILGPVGPSAGQGVVKPPERLQAAGFVPFAELSFI